MIVYLSKSLPLGEGAPKGRMRVKQELTSQQVRNSGNYPEFLPAFLISQKSEIFASFPPGEALGAPRQYYKRSFSKQFPLPFSAVLGYDRKKE